jgi:uncharacterized protein YbjT (DUF2867 family)
LKPRVAIGSDVFCQEIQQDLNFGSQSVFRVDQFRDVPHFASKLAVENALREFGVPYTILRPGYYIQNDTNL